MSLKFYGKSQEVAEGIIAMFESGNLPSALAPIFIHRHDALPCRKWSFQNQLLTAISGTNDARGFDQWKQAGRKVRKGARAFYILGPCLVSVSKENTDGEKIDGKALIGFRSIPVFRLEDTDLDDAELWARCGQVDQAAEKYLDQLPLRQVAAAWGISLTSYNGEGARYLGQYKAGLFGSSIALGVENLSTWCHELIHAADDRNGTLTKGAGQKADNEAVAELGGAVLLRLLGNDHEADLGGAWSYIKSYAKGDTGKAIRLCTKVINRVCTAVALVLDTAEKVGAVPEVLAA